MNTGTLLQRRKKSVRISKEKILLFLRSYREHLNRWAEVIADVRQNTDRLPTAAQEIYRTGSAKQLRYRMLIKLLKLMAARQVIEDDDIRQEVELIRAQERRYVNPVQPIHAPVDNQAGRQRADQNAPAARPASVAIPPRDPDLLTSPGLLISLGLGEALHLISLDLRHVPHLISLDLCHVLHLISMGLCHVLHLIDLGLRHVLHLISLDHHSDEKLIGVTKPSLSLIAGMK